MQNYNNHPAKSIPITLSIFPGKPKNSNTDGFKTVECQLFEAETYMVGYDWSPCIWREGYRLRENFLSSNCIGIDVDDGSSLDDAVKKIGKYSHLIMSTKSHQLPKKNSPVCDRYRVLIPTGYPITDESVYKHNALILSRILGGDRAQSQGACHFQPSKKILSVNLEGERYIPVRPPIVIPKESPFNQPKTKLLKIAHNMLATPDRYNGRNNTAYRAAHQLRSTNMDKASVVQFIQSRSDLPILEIQQVVESAWKR